MCEADRGWDECKNYTDVITCPIGQDRCAKAKAEALVGNKTYTYYVKGCAFDKECKDNDCSRIGQRIPNFKKIIKCNSACCKTDLCDPVLDNGAGISTVGVFTLFACVIVAFMR